MRITDWIGCFAAVLLACAGVPEPAQAAAPVVSNVYVDLVNSTVQIPDTTDAVTLEGRLHLVVRVVPREDGRRFFTVFANLPANVAATSLSGDHFVAIGAARHSDEHPGLIVPCIMPEGFTLVQADPANASRSLPPVTFSLNLLLEIAESGEVVGGVASTSRGILDEPVR